MKRKINIQLLGIATLAIVITLLLTVAICYQLFINQVVDDLRIQAHVICRMAYSEDLVRELAETPVNIEQDGLRVTLISEQGEVLYDTGENEKLMSNHSDRPEVKEALAQGEGWEVRKSATRDKNTFYYAMKTEGGEVLRVSQEAGSILRIFTAALPSIGIIMLFIFAVCAIITHMLTNSLLRPIKDVTAHLENQEDIVTYEELQPLIDTIQKQNASLLASVKIRQDFTANVSHELKTPLTSISGYAELIENGMVADGEDITRFAKEIHKNANRLLTLINDIIRLSELDSDETEEVFEKINLYDIVETCVSMLQLNAEKHHVEISMNGEAAYVYSTRQMMEELVFNLCDNAIRYNKENGKVEATVWNRSGKVILTVKDDGIGIPREHQDRIFERFYRVDKGRSKSTGGTGLGLAIVKHILSKHNAKLEMESEAGRGTQIRILF